MSLTFHPWIELLPGDLWPWLPLRPALHLGILALQQGEGVSAHTVEDLGGHNHGQGAVLEVKQMPNVFFVSRDSEF